MFWSLVLLLMQKHFMALLREGQWLQSPLAIESETDPDGITEAGAIYSPHIESLKGCKEDRKLLSCTTLHSSAPAASLILSGTFLLNCLSQARFFLLGSSVTIHTLAAGTLAWVFCLVTGCSTVLSGTFLLQCTWILP